MKHDRTLTGRRPLARVVGSVEIDRPARSGRMWPTTATTQLASGRHPDAPIGVRTAQVGVTTHERLRLLAMTFGTDAIVDRVEAGACSGGEPTTARSNSKAPAWSRRLARPPAASCFIEVVEGRLLGLSRPLEPRVAWLLQRQASADLRRLKHLLET